MMSTRYNIYFNGFIFCEFLNFAIVLLQFVVTHQFLSRRFLLYGLEVLLISVWISIPIYVTAAGLALLPSPLRGAASSSRQKPNVPNFSKDRSVSTDNGEKCWLIQKIRTIHRQLPATTGGGADQAVRRTSMPSASSALILSTTRSGVDKLHHCRALGQFLEISIRCSWFFGGGSFFSSSSDLFVSYIEPFSAGVDSDSIPGRKKKKRKIPGQPGCVTTCSP